MSNVKVSRAALALTAAIALSSAQADPRDDVMSADREFAKLAAAQGNRAAFVSFAAHDAMMFHPGVGPIKGHDAISASFDSADGLLEWWPEDGVVAANGDLAYTWGYWRYSAKDGAKGDMSGNTSGGEKRSKTATGNYVTIWRKLDGRWKWVVDLGVPAPLPATAPK